VLYKDQERFPNVNVYEVVRLRSPPAELLRQRSGLDTLFAWITQAPQEIWVIDPCQPTVASSAGNHRCSEGTFRLIQQTYRGLEMKYNFMGRQSMVQFKDQSSEDESKNEDMNSQKSASPETAPSSGKSKRKSDDEGHGDGSSKRKRKSKSDKNSQRKANGSAPKRRHSMSKPARDARDDPSPTRPNLDVDAVRSPSPVIDFDGLSRPSTRTLMAQLHLVDFV
jgi:hypothetical protein